MKIVEFDRLGKDGVEVKQKIIKNIEESARFIVIYYDKGNIRYHEFDMSAEDVICACEMTKLDIMMEHR